MPTRYRRISIVADPEFTAAVRGAEGLSGHSDAARVRELALIGARTVATPAGPDASTVARTALLRDHGARVESGDLLRASRRALRHDRHGGREAGETGTASLQWVRGER